MSDEQKTEFTQAEKDEMDEQLFDLLIMNTDDTDKMLELCQQFNKKGSTNVKSSILALRSCGYIDENLGITPNGQDWIDLKTTLEPYM